MAGGQTPFRRTSKSRKRKRRTHYKLTSPNFVACSKCGEPKQRHRVCESCGHYKEVEVISKSEVSEA